MSAGDLEGAQLGRLAHQGIRHFDQETKILCHDPQAFDVQAGLNFAQRPVFGRWSRLPVLVPAFNLSLASQIHLSPQMSVSFLGGLQSRSEHLSHLFSRASVPQIEMGVARDIFEYPGFEFLDVIFDL